jgi:hypothetical protein
MKHFLVLFREPDGRVDAHTNVETGYHSDNWKQWLELYREKGNLTGGSSLTLHGKLIVGIDGHISDSIHSVGTEIVGGFLLLKAENLDAAAAIVSTCPVFEFGGYAEVREYQEHDGTSSIL